MRLRSFFLAFQIFLLSSELPCRAGYFMFPIRPRNVLSITAGMGELRTNHFHGGLDVRTDYRTGLPIYAAAEGYVSRIHVSSHGYGNMLHIRHPNGLVTVYAHLEKFNNVVTAHCKAEQKKFEINEIDLYPEPGDLEVCRGDIIGLSGNSGSSGGPHLHFEIRDTADMVLNPMNFGFAEIKDKYNPYFSGLALRSFGIQSTINGINGRVSIPIARRGNGSVFSSNAITRVNGAFGVEMLARDRIPNGSQHTGISCIEMKLDGKEIFALNLASYSFINTGHINAHIDYETYIATGQKFQRCYLPPGIFNITQSMSLRNGLITLADNDVHKIELTVYDSYQNKATLQFNVQNIEQSGLITGGLVGGGEPQLIAFKTQGGLRLEIKGDNWSSNKVVTVYTQKGALQPQFIQTQKLTAVYFLPKFTGSIDSITFLNTSMKQPIMANIPSGLHTSLAAGNLKLTFKAGSLLDTCFVAASIQPEYIRIGHTGNPIFAPFQVRLNMPTVIKPLKCSAYLMNGSSPKWAYTKWDGQVAQFETKYFGKFKFFYDSLPPTARVIQSSPFRFAAIIGDNLSGIKSFRAELNGKWLLLSHDHKRNLIWADAEDLAEFGQGNLVLTVTDNQNNLKRVTTQI